MDTLVFRLHNIRTKYKIIWELAFNPDTGKQIVSAEGNKPDEKIDTVMKFVLNYKEGSAQQIRYSDKRKIPSSNHDVPFFIDQGREFLEVNVSIPKYFFGNNVLEVITPPHDKNYSVSQLSPYHHIGFWYRLIKEVAHRLIHSIAKNALPDEIDWNDFEVARIDFAVCQLFQTKEFAKKNLKYMSGVDKRHQRAETTGKQIVYQGQTLFFPSDHMSAKVYHKGTEFERLQKTNIIELNKKRKADALRNDTCPLLLSSNVKYSAEKVQELQAYADKLLRYEFTFRPGYMSYIFNQKMNKDWSDSWKVFKRLFNYLERSADNSKFLTDFQVKYFDIQGREVGPLDAVEKKYFVVEQQEQLFFMSNLWKEVSREFTEKEYRFFKILRKYGIVDRKDLKIWLKFMTRELNKQREFRWRIDGVRNTMLESVLDKTLTQILYVNSPVDETPTYVKFSRTVIKFMITELEKFFNNFQVVTMLTNSEFVTKIEAWNKGIEDKLLTCSKFAYKKLESSIIQPRTMRALIEFNELFARCSPKQVRGKYTKTTYHRLKKLHSSITGQYSHVCAAEFGVVNRDFNTIYKDLHIELNTGYFAKFYQTAFAGHYFV